MKHLKVNVVLIAFMVLASSAYVAAQQNGDKEGFKRGKNGNMYHREHTKRKDMELPGITDEQREKMKDMRIADMKRMLPLKNKLQEKEAQLKTLSTVDTPDMKKINNVIDEMGTVRTEMMKLRVAHQQEIRKQLTEEQRIIFDSRPHERNHQRMRYN